MPRITIALGAILIAVGVIAYIATSFASFTALIPAFLGAIIVICGLIALKKHNIGIYIALVVSILGILGTGMNVLQIGELLAGEAERPAAVITSVIAFLLLIIYVVLAMRSLIVARRQKDTETVLTTS